VYFYKRMSGNDAWMVRVVVLSENRDRSQDMLYDCICIYSTDACNRASARCRTHLCYAQKSFWINDFCLIPMCM
jgi:hypothetical protein